VILSPVPPRYWEATTFHCGQRLRVDVASKKTYKWSVTNECLSVLEDVTHSHLISTRMATTIILM
jgi:hypothetical protein